MSVSDPQAALPEPPAHVTSEAEQDRRLIRQMLAMTPDERLATLTNWARIVTRPGRDRPGSLGMG